MKKMCVFILNLMIISSLSACGADSAPDADAPIVTPFVMEDAEQTESENVREELTVGSGEGNLSGTVPDELEYIPAEYKYPAEQAGTLEKLTYQTWESFSYEERTQELTKEAWVYLPYGYSEEQKYNVFYLSHGGWSNETTIMGTDEEPHTFKYVIDHAIQDGKIQPLIIVLPTYNNTSPSDSGDYGLALKLTDQFHNELLNDLIPAVEGRYSTYAENTTPADIAASRDHRGFGGFSMGSVNTWCTFRYCLDYFRYFMPMSGSYTTDGEYMAELSGSPGIHGMISLSFLRPAQMILLTVPLSDRSWLWVMWRTVLSGLRIMKWMAIWHFWSGKDMFMMEQQVMNILIMGYVFSGMERNEHNLQEKD